MYDDVVLTSFHQVIEHQTHTGQAHHHGVGWARNLTPDVVTLFDKLQNEDAHNMSRSDLEPIAAVGTRSVTVSTDPVTILDQFPNLTASQAAEAGRLATTYQQHQCTAESCSNLVFPGQTCNKFFPQLPSLFPLVAKTPLLTKKGQQRLDDIYAIHTKLQGFLRNSNVPPEEDRVTTLVNLLERLGSPPSALPQGEGFTWQGVVFPNDPELQGLRHECGQYGRTQGEVLLLSLYHVSLLTRRHAKYLPARTVSEVYIAKYNPIVLLATQANMEIDLVLHTPTVWYNYMTKSGTSQSSLRRSLSQLALRGDATNKERVIEMMKEKKREVSLGEVFCRVDPELSLASKNVPVKYVNTNRLSAHLGGPLQAVVRDYLAR